VLGKDIENFIIPEVYADLAVTGEKRAVYCGTFDGRGNAIKFAATREDGETANITNRGLFGTTVSVDAVIKNTAFIGLAKNSSAGGCFAHGFKGVMDNCYVSAKLGVGKSSQGIIAYSMSGTISNTIVNATTNKPTNTNNLTARGTISQTGTGTIKNTFTIGNASLPYVVGGAKTPVKAALSADELKTAIGTALPAGYNSYWELTDTALSFNGEQVLTFTA
jgi:hypothetical protein